MPEKIRGSVSARFIVRFSRVRVSAKLSLSMSSGSAPPRSWISRASSPLWTYNEARFLVLCSVSISVPLSKSNPAWPDPLGDRHPLLLPVETPRDHEMEHHEQVILEFPDDALAHPAEPGDLLALHVMNRRVVGPEQRDRRHPGLFENAPANEPFHRFDVDHDVGKLGHGPGAYRLRGVLSIEYLVLSNAAIFGPIDQLP